MPPLRAATRMGTVEEGERGSVVIQCLSVRGGSVGSVTCVLTCCVHIWSQWGSEEVCT